MDQRRAFLSSTYKDLVEHREAVYRAIQRMDRWRCLRMENFGAQDWEADEFCRQKVAKCDLFIGILGPLYGSIHERSGLSYTEREYNAAVAASRPRLMFLSPKDFPVPADLMESKAKQRKQKKFRERVSQDRICDADWHSPDQLANSVVTAISNWTQKHPPKAKSAKEAVAPVPTLERQEKALRFYLKSLRGTCNALPLTAISEEWEPHRRAEVTLKRIYVELDTTSRVHLTKGKTFLTRKVEERPLAAIEAAANYQKLVVLGDPGAGKSSFANYLAYLVAGARLGEDTLPKKWIHGPLLPIRFLMRDLVSVLPREGEIHHLPSDRRDLILSQSISKYLPKLLTIFEASDACPRVEEELRKGNVLAIFDGLDEVPPEDRRVASRAVEAFSRHYPDNRFLVTCRMRSYEGEARLTAFDEVTLAPFDKPKINRFIAYWYQTLAGLAQMTNEQAAERTEDLQRAVKPMIELAQNPLLLTTMAVVHTAQVELPRERVKLYQRCVEVLFRRWHEHKAGKLPILTELGLSDLDLLAAMWEVAYVAHASGQPGEAGDLPRGEILGILARHLKDDYGKAQRFLQHVDERAGLLVGRGGLDEPIYSFPHRTFQEFLSGCHLALGGRNFGRRLRELLPTGDHWVLSARLGAEHLLHVVGDVTKVLDALYVLCPAAEPDKEADWRGIVWSGNIALEVGLDRVRADTEDPDGGPAYLSRLTRRLVQVVEKGLLAPPERAEAGVVLAHLGDQRPGLGLCSDGLPDIIWCEVEAGRFSMGSRRKDLAFLVTKYGGDMRWYRDEGWPKEERPLNLPRYYIARYPLTNTQFQAFVDDGGYTSPKWLRTCWTEAGRDWLKKNKRTGPYAFGHPFNLPNHPVVNICWHEALAFCNWLTAKTGESAKLKAWHNGKIEARPFKNPHFRLPTEAEWEKAARGTDGRIFPWEGEFDPNKCNTFEARIGSTSAGGIFPAGQSPSGAMDMAGNVWEWCQSLYKPYPYRAHDGREEIEAEGLRVIRGGSWGFDAWNARCAFRYRYFPGGFFTFIGFRVVLSPR